MVYTSCSLGSSSFIGASYWHTAEIVVFVCFFQLVAVIRGTLFLVDLVHFIFWKSNVDILQSVILLATFDPVPNSHTFRTFSCCASLKAILACQSFHQQWIIGSIMPYCPVLQGNALHMVTYYRSCCPEFHAKKRHRRYCTCTILPPDVSTSQSLWIVASPGVTSATSQKLSFAHCIACRIGNGTSPWRCLFSSSKESTTHTKSRLHLSLSRHQTESKIPCPGFMQLWQSSDWSCSVPELSLPCSHFTIGNLLMSPV